MKFRWNGFSLVDAPSSAAVIYTKRCNLSCDFCYNTDLLTDTDTEGDLTAEEVMQKIGALEKLNSKTETTYTTVDWLIISGGEPLIHDVEMLRGFLVKAKLTGLQTGLYTNGYFPKKLDALIDYLDYVHVDFKDAESFAHIKEMLDNCWTYYDRTDQLRYFIINTTILKSRHTLEHLLKMQQQLATYNPSIILQSELKRHHFVWTLTPFYNNNDRIVTVGNLKSNEESYSTDELATIIAGLS
jgi:organic radical activating enzyme